MKELEELADSGELKRRESIEKIKDSSEVLLLGLMGSYIAGDVFGTAGYIGAGALSFIAAYYTLRE